MKSRIKALIAAVTLCLMLPFMMIPASATMPLPSTMWYGDKSSGIINATPESDIYIERQKITFNLVDYPNIEDNSDYKSTVVTEYTLVNPTGKSDKIIIALPMGMNPDYVICDLGDFELKIKGKAMESETKYRLLQGSYAHYYGGEEGFVDIDLSGSTSNGINEGYAPWRMYEISLYPGERASVTLTAPVYPNIDTGYDPDTYFYSYYFSPYTCWKDYRSVDIVINTDYFITNSFGNSFTKTESGYELHIDSLYTQIDQQSSAIKNAVEFELCSVEIRDAVKEEPDNSGVGLLIILMLIIMPFVALWEGIEDVVEIIVNGIKDIFTK